MYCLGMKGEMETYVYRTEVPGGNGSSDLKSRPGGVSAVEAHFRDFLGGPVVKTLPCQFRGQGLIPGTAI